MVNNDKIAHPVQAPHVPPARYHAEATARNVPVRSHIELDGMNILAEHQTARPE